MINQRPSNHNGFVYPIIFLLFLSFMGCSSHQEQSKAGRFLIPKDTKYFPLKGNWELYRQDSTLMDLDTHTKNKIYSIKVPENGTINQQGITGNVVYRAIVSANFKDPAIYVPKIYGSAKVKVNGILIMERGTLIDEGYSSFLHSDVQGIEQSDSWEIIIQVSNKNFWKAGLVKAPVIGEYRTLYDRSFIHDFIHVIWIGGLFLMSAFFVSMFIVSKKRIEYMIMTTLSLLILVRFIIHGDHFIYRYLKITGIMGLESQFHLFVFLNFSIITFFTSYFSVNFKPSVIKQISICSIVVFASLAGMSWIIPLNSYASTSYIVFGIIIIGILLNLFYVILQLYLKPNLILGFGVTLVVLAAVNDAFAFFGVSQLELLPISLSLFLVLQFIILAKQDGLALIRAEGLNQLLDKKVRERTRTTIEQNDELERQAETLKELDAYKSMFYENVTHDLKTQLSLIDGYLERIISDENNFLSGTSELHINKLIRNLALVRSLNEQMYDLNLAESKQLILNFERVDVSSFITESVELFRIKAEAEGKKLVLKKNIPHDMVAKLDKNRFSRVLYNILNNSLNHIQEKGNIMVFLQNRNDKKGFTIGVYNSGDAIPQKSLTHMFDHLNNNDQSRPKKIIGMGIGLELAKEIITLHNGSIMVDGLAQQGTIFFISMPFNHDKKVAKNINIEGVDYKKLTPHINLGKKLDTIKYDPKKANVLIVDDNEMIREYIKDILEHDFAVDEAENGSEAYSKITTGYYDLIISDLMMPFMDGFELLKTLKNEKHRDIPVMIVSVRTDESDKLKALHDGSLDFLTKPFNPEELRHRVTNILKYKNSKGAFDDLNQKHKEQIEKDILGKMHSLIHDHIDDPRLSVAMIADELCMAERSAYRMIKNLTGKTPLDYVKSLRYDHAYELLSRHKVGSISEAARLIGVTNSTYFSAQFKKRFKVSPDSLLN